MEEQSYHLLFHSAEALVQLEQPNSNEIPEQRRILRDCWKSLQTIPTQLSRLSYPFLFQNSRHSLSTTSPLFNASDQDILLSAASYTPITKSIAIKSSDGDENLLIFWKNTFAVPFGPTLGDALVNTLNSAITELQSVYKPPKPPVTDKRHNEGMNSKKSASNPTIVNKPGVCGLWHFAWWFAKGQSWSKPPVISAHLINSAYK